MSNKRIRYIDVFCGFAVVAVLIAGSGVFGDRAVMVLSSLCPMAFYLGYGALHDASDIKDESSEKMLIKSAGSLIGAYILFGLIVCAKESYDVLFINTEKDLTKLKSLAFDTLSLKGTYYTGFLVSYFIAINAYNLIRKKCNMIVTGIIAAVFFGYVLYVSQNLQMLNYEAGTAKALICGLCYACFRAMHGFAFIFAGELLEMILVKNENIKTLTGICGILFMAIGTIVALKNSFVRSFDLIFGTPGIFVLSSFLLAIGLYMMARWIGQAGFIEYMGRNGKMIYLAFFVLGINEIQKIVSNKVFAATDNNFMTKAAAIFVIVILEAIVMFICNRLIFSKKAKDTKSEC